MREIGEGIDDKVIAGLGPRWIVHQHVSPTTSLLECLRRNGVVVLTVLRHPCDVLVSLKAFQQALPDEHREPHAAAMLGEGSEFGEGTVAFLRGGFAAQLNLSLLWWRVGAIAVRYEELLVDPVGTLACLGAHLGHVPESRLRAAVALTNINRMRRRHAGAASHFRKGSAGEWHRVLPAVVVELFRATRPYPAIFAALGYTLEPLPIRRPDGPDLYPFRGAAAFDNGVPLSDFIVELYFIARVGRENRWPEPARTDGPGSFFEWLNAPADDDPHRSEGGVTITNLLAAIRTARDDLSKVFPDPFGADRLAFANWYLLCAMDEYRLDLAFFAPVIESIAHARSLAPPV